MLYAFSIIFPLLAAAKLGGDATAIAENTELGWGSTVLSQLASPSLTFVTVLAYFGAHEVARTLEDPFTHPPNELPAPQIQEEFNARLIATWDSATAALAAELTADAGVIRLLDLHAGARRADLASTPTASERAACAYARAPATRLRCWPVLLFLCVVLL